MNARLIFAALGASVLVINGAAKAPPARAQVQASQFKRMVQSSFSQNDEGWRVSPSANLRTPQYSSVAENIFFEAKDTKGSSDIFFWRAPAKFLGDQSAAWRGYLTFQIGESSAANPIDSRSDIQLVTRLPNGFPIVADYDIPAPGNGFIRYEIPLDEEEGWLNNATGEPLSRRDFVCMLGHLTGIAIRGRFSLTPEVTGTLDNPGLFRLKRAAARVNSVPDNGERHDFGLVRIAERGETDVLIENTGTAPLKLDRLDLPDPFRITPESGDFCGFIAPGNSEVFNVAYVPTDIGRHKANLTFKTNDPRARKLVIKLKGRGAPSMETEFLTCTPNPISFGDVRIGMDGRKDVVVKNVTNANQSIRWTATGGFSFGGGGAASLSAGQTVTIPGGWRPSKPGATTGELVFSDASSSDTLLRVPISGNALPRQ